MISSSFMKKICLKLLFLILVGGFSSISAQTVSNTDWEVVIPSPNLPKELKVQKANNNLDFTFYQDRYYLAFRTAPNHFASKKVMIYVISSTDLENWDYEWEVHVNSDMREPRFVAFQEKLFLYFFEGGSRMLRFEPKHLHYTYLDEVGKWKDHQTTSLDGYVPWRLRVHKGLLYLSAYYGKNAYNNAPVDLRLFTSTNGHDFEPISEAPQILHPEGIGEGEFIFDESGNIWGVARSEFDGSYTFFASKDSLDKWKVKHSIFKYDSSLIFEDEGDIFLVARRNMDGDGRYVRKPNKPRRNLIRYSFTKKKTAIFKLDKVAMEWEHLKDFKSTGDTAFPGIAQNKDKSGYILMNYSSDITKREKNWIKGQLGKTYIYCTELRIDR